MKKSVRVSIIISIIILLVIASWIFIMMKYPRTIGPDNLPSQNAVLIEGFQFTPKELTIKVGENVTWTNNDGNPHTVKSDFGSELSSGTLSKGETFSHKFNTAGTFTYHCGFHPGMKARIIVE